MTKGQWNDYWRQREASCLPAEMLRQAYMHILLEQAWDRHAERMANEPIWTAPAQLSYEDFKQREAERDAAFLRSLGIQP